MESNRLTIIVSDGAVYRDQNTFINLDLSGCNIPPDVHALQWLNNSGQIEYIGPVPNDNITELPQWALDCIQVWETKYQATIDEQNQNNLNTTEPL